MPSASLPPQVRGRGVTAVLGPTNTGKTHLAIERMLGHQSGMIGLPLRLLAREVYQRVVERVGADQVALVTGEEKIRPEKPRYWIATTEAMPRDLDVGFVAVDEIQLASDRDRGHIFTDAMLNRRGRDETLVIGSSTMRPLVESLIPGANVISRPRLSKLTYAGDRKLARLPRRSAIVAFSAEEVYAIAELIRRQRGGAAVVLGALSPRTRNAQVDLFQAGDVDHIVATDAIGMGLNLDIDHVAFAADHKFDGHRRRKLTPAEFGQIAGRAGRHVRDGTFGTSGRAETFDQEMIDRLEGHSFETVRMLQWRNPDLDFASVAALRESLAVLPREPGLARADRADDEQTFDIAAAQQGTSDMATSADAVARLWALSGLPDYRKVAPHAHAELVAQLYGFVMREGAIPTDWFAREVVACDRTDGDIDTLSGRIAQIRTWTFCANRDWLKDPEHWQRTTRAVEDKLSDALHELLVQRFVDRRTSVLMRRLRENTMLEAEVTPTGDVMVEGQHVGQLRGFRFTSDATAVGPEAKALNSAAVKALAGEIETRATRLSAAPDDAFVLGLDGTIRFIGEPVAKLQTGDRALEPRALLLADELLAGAARDGVEARLSLWLKAHVNRLLGPLLALEGGEGVEGIARGVAFQLAEHLGVMDRATVANDIKALDQDSRAALRKLGVRFGAYSIYTPALLKPAPRALAAQLWALRQGGIDQKGLDDIAHLSASGRTSMAADETIPRALYRVAGFRVAGPRAIRVDILERLADLIRPAIAFKAGMTDGVAPAGAFSGDGFTVTVGMTSLAGCAGDDFAAILKSLGYRMERRPPLPPRPAPAPMEPIAAELPATEEAVAENGATSLAGSHAGVPMSPELPPPAPPPEVPPAVIPQVDDPPVEQPLIDDPAGIPPPNEIPPLPEIPPINEPPPAPSPMAAQEPITNDPQPLTKPSAEAAPEPSVEAASEPVAQQAAEPLLVEVWRPARFDRGDNRPRRQEGDRRHGRESHGRDGRPRPGGPQEPGEAVAASTPSGADGTSAQGRRDGGRQDNSRQDSFRRNGGRRDGGSPDRRQVTAPLAAAGAAEETTTAIPAEQRRGEQSRGGQRNERGGREGSPHGRQDHGAGRSRQDQRAPVWQRGDSRPPRDDNRSPREPRAEKLPDPLSPFAKLLALKEQLEAGKPKT